jgi:hypothetical protein
MAKDIYADLIERVEANAKTAEEQKRVEQETKKAVVSSATPSGLKNLNDYSPDFLKFVDSQKSRT